jgi:hypothetical protein
MASTAVADDSSLDKSPWLAAQYCYEHSPTEVLDRLKAEGWFDCESCIDDALTIYAEHLRPLVNQRHAKAARIRKDLHTAVATFDKAFHSVTSGNWYGHATDRHAAWVEWFIVQACVQPDYMGGKDGKGYSHANIRTVMLLWYHAHVPTDPDDPRPTPEAYLKTVDVAIAALDRAERGLTADQASYLRALMMSRIARWL